MAEMKRVRTIIIGAAGRDFHNFNMIYRDNERYDVVAFTAAQIPNIAGRKYPASLAGTLYPKGIPIFREQDLEKTIREYDVEEAVFSYSDISYNHVMSIGSRVTTAGAHFKILSIPDTMLVSKKPVVSVCAVRTGSGKSQTCRKVSRILRDLGYKVAVVRHPMPYGDLEKQKVQRFATVQDLHRHHCTIEEMEEYEPHITSGSIVYAGVDYQAILEDAEREADIIIWDGGNNDSPFFEPDLKIVVTDPLRVGNELSYYPGESNLRMADVVIINKIDSAEPRAIFALRENIRRVNTFGRIIEAASPIFAEHSDKIAGKRVLVIEDGPTLTHGEMRYGAGTVAAQKFGASEIIDPRPYAVGEIKKTYETYPNIGILLPAMGYGKQQIKDLEATINKTPCDAVIIGTPINLTRIVKMKKPAYRVYYELEEIGEPSLKSILTEFTKTLK
ncbi:MAG: GTPase [Ignavibacteria bacterium]|nr:GTPase [Ignavibacteria bacterium]